MKILNIFGMSLIVLSNICLLCYVFSDICSTVKRKKNKTDDFDFDSEDDLDDYEPYVPELSSDALQKLKPGRESYFVEHKVFPAVPRVLSFLTMDEREWVSLVLSGFIGIIVETAPEREKDFTTVLMMLKHTEIPEDADEDWKSVIDYFMEDYKESPSYRSYEHFRKYCPNRQSIYYFCSQIIKTIIVTLHGYIPESIAANCQTNKKGTKEYE